MWSTFTNEICSMGTFFFGDKNSFTSTSQSVLKKSEHPWIFPFFCGLRLKSALLETLLELVQVLFNKIPTFMDHTVHTT